jgi:chromosome segregation ATPase
MNLAKPKDKNSKNSTSKENLEENLIKKIFEDTEKNVKEVDIAQFEEELKKRFPSFSEEISIREQLEKLELPDNIKELIDSEFNARLKIIDEFISKKLGEVDSRLRELEKFSTRLDNIESSLLKLQSELNKFKELNDSRYIDLEKELHRLETQVKQQVERTSKDLEEKVSVLELKIKTFKDQLGVMDNEVSLLKNSYNNLKEVIKDVTEKLSSKIMEFQELRKSLESKLEEIENQIKAIKLEENTVQSIKDKINLFKSELDKLEKEIDLMIQKSQPEVILEQEIEVKKPYQAETQEKIEGEAEVKEENLKTEEGEKKHKHLRFFGRK